MTPPNYPWVCHVCEHVNESGTANCSECSFPAVATGRDIANARIKWRRGLWDRFKAVLNETLEKSHLELKKAHEHADQTFSDRLKKVSEESFVSALTECKQAMNSNYELAEGFYKFCTRDIAMAERNLRASIAEVRKHQFTKELSVFGRAGEMGLTTQSATGVLKIARDVVCLSALLACLLGQRAAYAFEIGAKKEGFGAIFDPSSNVITLLRRLHAVATRTLRDDQIVAETNETLRDFRKSMDQWVDVTRLMSRNRPFDEALKIVFIPPSN